MALPVKVLQQISARYSLSDFLPYIAYGDGLFVLADGSVGFIFECLPLILGGQDTHTMLKGLYEMEYPENTTIQISMLASRNTHDILSAWAARRTRPESIYHAMTSRRIAHLSQETILPEIGYKLRDFRLFVSVNLPVTGAGQEVESRLQTVKSCQARVEQILKTINLCPQPLDATQLIHLLYEILNPGHEPRDKYDLRYDSREEIRRQIMFADNPLKVQSDYLELDGRTIVPLSVKQYPESFSLPQANLLLGDLFQNTKQIFQPLLVTLNCIVLDQEKTRKTFEMKATTTRYQSFGPLARLVPKLDQKNRGFEQMLQGLTRGESLIQCYLHAIVFGQTPDEAKRAAEAMISIWRPLSIIAQTDSYITLPLFLDALPLGLKAREHRTHVKRARTMLSSAAVSLSPVQADWKGTGTPTLLLSSRRGQIMAVDIFDKVGGNSNLAVVATTGGGKSFLVNELILSYLATGARVWVIDVGRSYQKLCGLLNGQFIEFSEETNICLNPFTRVNPDRLDDEMEVLKPLVAQMASPSQAVSDLENAFLEQAIKEAFLKHQNTTTITHVAGCLEKLDDTRARDLARMLYPYCAGGSYARYFEGQNNVELTSEFIVLELEELKTRKDLQSVVMLFLMYVIQQFMYLGSKEERKICIIDEAWDLMGEGNTAKFIETGYRRVRKYNGAMVTITQGLNDLYGTPCGQAVAGNSDFLFLLQQKAESLAAFRASQKIALDDFSFELLRSVHTMPGMYSEVFIHTPQGRGVGRLIVDPFSYYLYTTTPSEVVKVEHYLDQGLSITEAIEKCLQEK